MLLLGFAFIDIMAKEPGSDRARCVSTVRFAVVREGDLLEFTTVLYFAHATPEETGHAARTDQDNGKLCVLDVHPDRKYVELHCEAGRL